MQHYRDMARDRSHDATESTIFVCGMALLDADDPFYDVFHCDPSLDCNAHIKAHFYAYKIQYERVEMCFYCVGEFDSRVERCLLASAARSWSSGTRSARGGC